MPINLARDQADFAALKRGAGISFDGAQAFLDPEDGWKENFQLAADAQPSLVTVPNTGIPAFLVTVVDPDIVRVATAKNQAAEIFGEVRRGSFIDVTAVFPVVEHTGEVSSYGDFSQNGRSGANTNFPQREAYIYQTILEYGELELERAGAARIGWAAELKESAIKNLNKFQNLTYFLGIAGLQNYGLLNDPSLSPAIAPGVKAAGGVQWWNGTVINATANEIYADIQALFVTLVNQTAGLVDEKSKLTLALSPHSAVALTTTNSFNVNVMDLIKKNFPGLEIKTAVQYGVLSASNPQGSAAGEIVQLLADDIEGNDVGFCAFNEKLRGGPVIRELSSFKQKMSQGTWGAVLKYPAGISQMIGV